VNLAAEYIRLNVVTNVLSCGSALLTLSRHIRSLMILIWFDCFKTIVPVASSKDRAECRKTLRPISFDSSKSQTWFLV